MRHHWSRSLDRGSARPAFETLDRQPTQAFGVAIGRCRFCGDQLRAVAGGVWTSRRTGGRMCPARVGRMFGRTEHEIDATAPESRYPRWVIGLVVVLGLLVVILAVALGGSLGGW